MLKTRITTGAVITVIMTLVIIFSHIPWVLNTMIAALSVQAIFELFRATNLKDKKVLYIFSCIAALLISFISIPGMSYIIVLLFAATISLFIYLMLNLKNTTKIHPWMTLYMGLAISFFFKSMTSIRQMDNGVFLLGMAVLVPVITDIAAYFVGRNLGKYKLAPVISPKKTIEGSIGGTLYSCAIVLLIASILQYFNVFTVNLGTLIVYTIIASIIGQFGDLAMSSIKRIVGIKDYGKLLPGHGGILDRFDSMLFVMPFTYLFCVLFGAIFATA